MKHLILLLSILIFASTISVNVNAGSAVGGGCRDNDICEQDEGSSCIDCLGASCGCSDARSNVCGTNGVSYKNECTAKCVGTTAVHSGVCYCGDGYCSPQEKLIPDGCRDCGVATCTKSSGSSCSADIECCADYRCINKTCTFSDSSSERGNSTSNTITSPIAPISQSNTTTNTTQPLPRSNDTTIISPIERVSNITTNISQPVPILKATNDNRGVIETTASSAEYYGKLEIKESKIIMETSAGKKQIIMPESAVEYSAASKEEVKKIELKEKLQKPVYSVSAVKQAKLLFFIPVSMDIETDVDAETGKIISVNKPWWGFLAFG